MPKGRGKNNTLSTQTTDASFVRVLSSGNYNKVLHLVKAGADVNQSVLSGSAPLHLTCQMGHVDCTRLLIKYKADIDKPRTDDGATPLLIACYNGHVNCARSERGRRQSEDR